MSWLLIAIISYFLLAFVFVVDKFLLSKTNLKPAAYAFYVGLLGVLALLLFPFGFSVLPIDQMIYSFVAGIFFVLAILFFYKSVQVGEVSRIAPIIGGMVPIFSLILTYLFLREALTNMQLLAFFFLVLGGVVIIWPAKNRANKKPLIRRLPVAILAAFCFAGSFVLTKHIYSYQPFINGFIWIRLGGVLGALMLLILPKIRQTIFDNSKVIKLSTGGFLLANKGLSAGAFILLNYAIFLGRVALVNALQGVQYVFLLLVAFFLSSKFPNILKEHLGRDVIIKRISAIILICIGLGILAF